MCRNFQSFTWTFNIVSVLPNSNICWRWTVEMKIKLSRLKTSDLFWPTHWIYCMCLSNWFAQLPDHLPINNKQKKIFCICLLYPNCCWLWKHEFFLACKSLNRSKHEMSFKVNVQLISMCQYSIYPTCIGLLDLNQFTCQESHFLALCYIMWYIYIYTILYTHTHTFPLICDQEFWPQFLFWGH